MSKFLRTIVIGMLVLGVATSNATFISQKVDAKSKPYKIFTTKDGKNDKGPRGKKDKNRPTPTAKPSTKPDDISILKERSESEYNLIKDKLNKLYTQEYCNNWSNLISDGMAILNQYYIPKIEQEKNNTNNIFMSDATFVKKLSNNILEVKLKDFPNRTFKFHTVGSLTTYPNAITNEGYDYFNSMLNKEDKLQIIVDTSYFFEPTKKTKTDGQIKGLFWLKSLDSILKTDITMSIEDIPSNNNKPITPITSLEIEKLKSDTPKQIDLLGAKIKKHYTSKYVSQWPQLFTDSSTKLVSDFLGYVAEYKKDGYIVITDFTYAGADAKENVIFIKPKLLKDKIITLRSEPGKVMLNPELYYGSTIFGDFKMGLMININNIETTGKYKIDGTIDEMYVLEEFSKILKEINNIK